ncbi:MAG: hypothetical protein GY729_05415, partial [Desulfobacteraceae bacterium]|nr:hypothetical protein [Desulfobacteraceae bacterium]
MEKFTYKLEDMLQEKLSLFKQLNAIVMEERQSIIKMDIDSLWRTSKLKKKVALKVEKIRERILCAFEEDSVRVDMDIRSFSISYLIRTIPLPAKLKESLRKIKLEIENEK